MLDGHPLNLGKEIVTHRTRHVKAGGMPHFLHTFAESYEGCLHLT